MGKKKEEKEDVELLEETKELENDTKLNKEMLKLEEEITTLTETNKSLEEIYNSYFVNNDIIHISNVEDLLKIGTNEQKNINGKIYTFSNDKIYLLKNNLEFSSIELELEEDWINVLDREEFNGIFDFQNNTITVTNLDGSISIYPSTEPNVLILKDGVHYLQYAELSQDLKQAIDNEKISNVLEETIGGQDIIAVIPTGYTVIPGTEGTASISDGLVIKDEYDNEFVWIPIQDVQMSSTYVDSATNKTVEPKALTSGSDKATNDQPDGPYKYDSQQELDFYFGTNYFTYPANISDVNNPTDFSYGVHYNEMVTSVNAYGGFYISRYEVTIDDNNNIGSKSATTVLAADKYIFGTTAYRWWGLYYALRNSDVYGNGLNVQTNMIWGQQWMRMINYFDNNNINCDEIDMDVYRRQYSMFPSGEVTYTNKTDDTDVISDEIFNIFDLRMNACEWTAEAAPNLTRTTI